MHTQVSSNATVLKTASGSAKVKYRSYFKAYNRAYYQGKKKALWRGKSEATLFSIVEFCGCVLVLVVFAFCGCMKYLLASMS